MLISDTGNRLLVYSLSSGRDLGRIFGNGSAMALTSNLLAVSNERDKIFIYDLETLDQIDEFTFASPVIAKQFSADGKQLVVLTGDQTATFLDVAGRETETADH